MKINNIEQLRNHALATLEKLESKEIDVVEAGVTAKLCETIISTVKQELVYAQMLQKETPIKFLEYKDTQKTKLLK